MYTNGKQRYIPPEDCYNCANYNLSRQKYVVQCSSHSIQTWVIRQLVLDTIKKTCDFAISNEQEFLNFENDLIHVAGSLEETHIRPFQAAALPSYVQYLREHKISELKEICGNRDFQQGATAQGVTAYSAIAALQEAGNKLSRDMIAESYDLVITKKKK